MVNGLHIDLPFLKLEEIVAKAERGERLSQRELSNLLSRTFGPNIDLLTFVKGKNESENKFDYITNLNINARFTDTIEDGKLKKSAKLDAFRRLAVIYNKIDRIDIDVEDLIRTDLSDLEKDAIKGALDKKEELFIKQYCFGNALRELKSYKPSIKNTIKSCMNSMIVGMSSYVSKGKLETIADLKDYCFFVAGTVGDALNRTVQIEDGESLNFNNARSMGAYVQITNIIKGYQKDKELEDCRIKFIPDELHICEISFKDLFEQNTKLAISMREKVLESMLSIAEEYFQSAAQYVIDIPRRFSGYLAFCGTALALSQETQKLIKNSGAERVFRGDESAIKVSRNLVDNVVSFAYRGVQIDEGIKYLNWLNDYRKDPSKFPFEGKCKWAFDVLGLK